MGLAPDPEWFTPDKDPLRSRYNKDELRDIILTKCLPDTLDDKPFEIMDFQIEGVIEMFLKHEYGLEEVANAVPLVGKTPETPNTMGALLADEMGLGKTIQVLIYVNLLKVLGKPCGKVLIICPNSLRIMWMNKIKGIVNDIPENIEYCTTSYYVGGNVIVASYEGVRQWWAVLAATEWDLVAFDEFHLCKNPTALRSIATFKIKGKRMIGVTGTPIVSFVYEAWPLFHHLDPVSYYDFPSYEYRYCWGQNNKWARNLPELQSRLYTGGPAHIKAGITGVAKDRPGLMIRRLKKDVLDHLPKKRRQVIELPADGKLAELVKLEQMLWAGSEGKAIYGEILKELNVLQEGESDEQLEAIIESLKGSRRFFFQEISKVRHQMAVLKIPMVIDHIQNTAEEVDKIVVFTHHHEVAKALRDTFKDTMGAVVVTGEVTDVEVRDARVQQFQKDEKCRLFIGSLRVAGLGFTLTSSHHAVFAELDWTPSVLTQCEDRLHRIGQEHNLLIQHLVVSGSMDSFMAKKVVAKQKTIRKALDQKSKEKGDFS